MVEKILVLLLTIVLLPTATRT